MEPPTRNLLTRPYVPSVLVVLNLEPIPALKYPIEGKTFIKKANVSISHVLLEHANSPSSPKPFIHFRNTRDTRTLEEGTRLLPAGNRGGGAHDEETHLLSVTAVCWWKGAKQRQRGGRGEREARRRGQTTAIRGHKDAKYTGHTIGTEKEDKSARITDDFEC